MLILTAALAAAAATCAVILAAALAAELRDRLRRRRERREQLARDLVESRRREMTAAIAESWTHYDRRWADGIGALIPEDVC